MPFTRRARAILAALLAVVAAIACATATVMLITTDDPATPWPATTIKVDGPDADRKPDDTITLTPAAEAELAAGVTATDIAGDTHRELAAPLREPDDGPVVLTEGPLAASEIPGCRVRFVQNSSSRNGTPVKIIVWHQTVSRDRPGVSDQDGLTAFANTRSSGVSWHALIGRQDGLCTYTVPLNLKAWTQGNANPFSVGIEVQAFGDEPTYTTGAGTAKLISVTRYIGRQYDIPMRRGLVQNCRPIRSGIVEHSDLGACGGGHADVTATGPDAARRAAGWDIDPLINLAADRVTTTDRVTCRKLNAWRNAGRPHGQNWERNSIRRKNALTARGVSCLTTGPVKR